MSAVVNNNVEMRFRNHGQKSPHEWAMKHIENATQSMSVEDVFNMGYLAALGFFPERYYECQQTTTIGESNE